VMSLTRQTLQRVANASTALQPSWNTTLATMDRTQWVGSLHSLGIGPANKGDQEPILLDFCKSVLCHTVRLRWSPASLATADGEMVWPATTDGLLVLGGNTVICDLLHAGPSFSPSTLVFHQLKAHLDQIHPFLQIKPRKT
jgi:hypothetical protein